MKLILLLLLLLSSHSLALELNYLPTKFENFTIGYLKDLNKSKTINDVKNIKFSPILNTHAFSGNIGQTWYKIELRNSTSLRKKTYLHLDYAYYSREIDIFEFSDKDLLDQERFNILQKGESNKLTGSSLIYEIELNSGTSRTIYIKNIPMVSSLFSLNIYDEKTSRDSLINFHFFSIIIVSILFTLAFYNATLYFFNRRKEFILYALYLLAPALGLLYKYGILFSHFHLYSENTYWFNLTAILMPAFLILFVKHTLNTKAMDKKINYVLNSILLIIAINISVAFIIDLTFAIEVFKLMFFFTVFALLYLIIYLFKAGHPLAILFASAYAFYVAGLIFTILAMSGIIELNFLSFHSGGIGIIIEGLLFSYLMHNNVKLLEHKVREQREVIITKNKKAQLGDMISAITHQWKQPLSRISSITSVLDFKLSNKQEIIEADLSKKISQIDSNVKFLSETIDDFKDFFNPHNIIESCNITNVIDRAIALSKDDTLVKQIEIKKDLSFDKMVNINKNELLHIILNILQNSKEALSKSEQEIKLIKVIGYMKDDKIYIDILDNAGGINEETLPFIFNEHYTTKKKKSGSGLGLYLTKIILEDHLQGSIEATNTQDGAMFRIII